MSEWTSANLGPFRLPHLPKNYTRGLHGRQRTLASGAPTRTFHLRPCRGLFAVFAMPFVLAMQPADASRTLLTAAPVTALRAGPSPKQPHITQLPADVPVWAETNSGPWYRVRLREGLSAWAFEQDLKAAPNPGPRPVAHVTNISVEPWERGVRVSVDLTSRVPFRVRQTLSPCRLHLDLFGVRLAGHGIRCRPIEAFITALVPEQVTGESVDLSVGIDATRHVGHDIHYASGSRLVLEIRRPYPSRGLRGKSIALDPGHGGHDFGAVGPTGLREKDVNLAVALQLRDLLLARGADVIMTRETDVSIAGPDAALSAELAGRVNITRNQWPDVFVSIHNNHIGRGDPASVRGTETYYWTPMSRRLAEVVQESLCAEIRTENRLVAWRSFRVLRDTDCPRVLLECVYLSHPQEEALMRDACFRLRAAEGILKGLEAFFDGPAQ